MNKRHWNMMHDYVIKSYTYFYDEMGIFKQFKNKEEREEIENNIKRLGRAILEEVDFERDED